MDAFTELLPIVYTAFNPICWFQDYPAANLMIVLIRQKSD